MRITGGENVRKTAKDTEMGPKLPVSSQRNVRYCLASWGRLGDCPTLWRSARLTGTINNPAETKGTLGRTDGNGNLSCPQRCSKFCPVELQVCGADNDGFSTCWHVHFSILDCLGVCSLKYPLYPFFLYILLAFSLANEPNKMRAL